MISADIPMTPNSTADLSLTIPEFIEYSIKNDLNIVTSKWLAHTKKITIAQAKAELKKFWDSIGKGKGYCATFSVLHRSETENLYSMELIDFDKLDNVTGEVISSEIYAIHAIPLKDKSVQLGMINVPIFDVIGEIEAPWIESKVPEIITNIPTERVEPAAIVQSGNPVVQSAQPLSQTSQPDHTIEASQPPGKKMKMVQKTRTFMHDGYQQVETYNELVEVEEEETRVETPKPAAPAAQTKSKQSSMMSFFKKK